MPARSVSCEISGAKGVFRFSLTVAGSTTSIVSIAEISGRRKEPGVFRWRSSENFTASASIGSPSWKVTPGRSLIVTVRPSGLVSWERAS